MSDTIILDKPDNTRLSRLTIADMLLVLIAVGAAVMRFSGLGRIPLSPAEAAEAWAVWQFWQPDGAVVVGSPAYFSLTSLITPLLGYSDVVARLVPPLFGLGVVLLPALLRRQLGTIGTLVASLLLAVSPIQAIVSRTAGGDAIALFAILLLFVAGLRYDETADSRWFITLFAGLALGLTSSPPFYSGLFTLAWLVRAGWRGRLASVEGALRRRTAVIALTLFISLSTLFLWHLPGLGAAAMLPADWLGQFRLNGADLLDSLLALVRYEPFLVLAGGTAVFWASRRDDPLARRLVTWLTGALVLPPLQSGSMNNTALITLPLALLIGLMASDLLLTRLSRLGWAWAGGLFLLSGLVFVNLARYSRVITRSPQDFTSAWVILLAVTVALVTLYFIGTWEMTAVTQGAFLAFLVFFVFYQWGTGWWLSHEAANDPRERWVTMATDDEVRLLIKTLQDISRQATNSDHDLDIFSSVDEPVLRWYLRDFRQARFGHSLPVGAQNETVISRDQADLAPGSDYVGADYGLIRNGLQPLEVPGQTPGLDVLRWWLLHESSLAINEERVILWWRTDLSKGS